MVVVGEFNGMLWEVLKGSKNVLPRTRWFFLSKV